MFEYKIQCCYKDTVLAYYKFNKDRNSLDVANLTQC